MISPASSFSAWLHQPCIMQGRIQKFAKGGKRPPRSVLPLFPSPSSSFHPLRSRPLKPDRGSGERCNLPRWSPGGARPKTNLVHSKAARQPLVAITLNIQSTMYSYVTYHAVTDLNNIDLRRKIASFPSLSQQKLINYGSIVDVLWRNRMTYAHIIAWVVRRFLVVLGAFSWMCHTLIVIFFYENLYFFSYFIL